MYYIFTQYIVQDAILRIWYTKYTTKQYARSFISEKEYVIVNHWYHQNIRQYCSWWTLYTLKLCLIFLCIYNNLLFLAVRASIFNLTLRKKSSFNVQAISIGIHKYIPILFSNVFVALKKNFRKDILSFFQHINSTIFIILYIFFMHKILIYIQ